MKILLTIDRYPPSPGGGGATEVVRQVARNCVKLGHNVTVACASNDLPKQYLWEGVDVRRFRISSPFGQSILGISGEKAEFEKLITDPGFDVVLNYAAQTWHTALTFPKLGQIRGAKVLCACGFSGLIGFRRILYARYFRRLPRFLKNYDAVVYHSSNYIDKRFGDVVGLKNGVVIPNAVESSSYGTETIDIRGKYKIDTKHIIVCVGDHYKNKGHSRVIQAFQRAASKDATLIIFGRNVAGPLSSCHRKCHHTAGRSSKRIVLEDNASREEIQSALAVSSVFLSGSWVEAFPLVILESMASGVPFVAFEAGNIRELSGGVVVGSIQDMSDQLDNLLLDPANRMRLGQLGLREQRKLYDWSCVVPSYIQLFRGILDQRG